MKRYFLFLLSVLFACVPSLANKFAVTQQVNFGIQNIGAEERVFQKLLQNIALENYEKDPHETMAHAR